MYQPIFRDSQEAFKDAIASGTLSTDPMASNYAGRHMYMHTEPDGRDAFKNRDTRQYVYTAPRGWQSVEA